MTGGLPDRVLEDWMERFNEAYMRFRAERALDQGRLGLRRVAPGVDCVPKVLALWWEVKGILNELDGIDELANELERRRDSGPGPSDEELRLARQQVAQMFDRPVNSVTNYFARR